MSERERPRGRASGRPDRSRSRSGDRTTTDSRRSGAYAPREEYGGRGGDERSRHRDENRGRGEQFSRDSSRQPYGGSERGGFEGGDRGGYGGDRRGFGGGDRGGYGGGDRGGYGGGDRGGYGGGDRGGGRGYDRGGHGGFGSERGGYGGDRGGFGGGRGGHFGGDRGGRGGGRGGGGGGYNEAPIRKAAVDIELYTNYFEILKSPNWTLYQYHIDYDPPIESKRLRIGLFRNFSEQTFGKNLAFDGTTLFTLVLLEKDTEIMCEKKFDSTKVKCIIKKVGEVNSASRESVRVLNIIFKRFLGRCKFQEFGKDRMYFDFTQMTDLERLNIKVAEGYKASIELFGTKLLLCTELAHKLINIETVREVMSTLRRKHGDAELRASCVNYLVGQTVITNYNHKTYKIADIDFEKSPLSTFQKRGVDTSFVQYYQDQYNIRIRDVEQPMLVSLPSMRDQRGGRTEPILLVPELCALTGTILMKDFAQNFQMKKELDAITKLNPEVRYNRLKNFINKIKLNPDVKNELESWQIEFSPDVVKVQARQLETISIFFKNKGGSNNSGEDAENVVSNTDRGWDRMMRSSPHIKAIPLEKWIIIYTGRDENKALMLSNELYEVARPMEFTISQPEMCRLNDNRGSPIAFANMIRDKCQNPEIQLVLCIVPNSAKDIYDSIKKTCCLELGIPSQVVTSNIINNNNMVKTKSVITKVAIQMNCKLGGEIWGINVPMNNVMVVGVDFYKDSLKKNMSCAAFIASMNGMHDGPIRLTCTTYFSRCALQPRGQEFADNLEVFMTDALRKYYEKNQTYPARIFMYRDGVSDGQFAAVKEFEVPQIRRAFDAIQNYNPKFTLCIVKKRGNTRFFYRGNRSQFENAPIGSVVDNKITKTEGSEFYLISQSSNQGTVSPTHYHVIEGEKELAPERMQNLTYRFTHMYYNWPGQIRVPAPCHYAHKLAHLVGESLHTPHSPKLDELLFYL